MNEKAGGSFGVKQDRMSAVLSIVAARLARPQVPNSCNTAGQQFDYVPAYFFQDNFGLGFIEHSCHCLSARCIAFHRLNTFEFLDPNPDFPNPVVVPEFRNTIVGHGVTNICPRRR